MTDPAGRRAAAAAFAALLAFSAPASALFEDDEARRAILDLREKMAAAQNAQMQLASQLEELREQNRILTGQVEKLTNSLNQQQRSSRDIFTNLDRRMAALEPHTETIDGKEVSVQAEEKRRYDLALSNFSEGNYADCQKLFESLIADYPKTAYMPAALYWLGNALFAQGESAKAVNYQKRLIQRYPRYEKLPDAMLTKAAAEASLGRKEDSLATLNQVIKRYPGTEAAKLAQQRKKAVQ